jgi:pyruvate/2-oxoglutarate dehydrogenase complex dihydrolipoamide acyltransferase (E2) component
VTDDSRPLDYAERWMRDSLRVLRPAFAAHQVTADMTHALERLEALRAQGIAASATHLLVQAAARALARNPDLHDVIAANRRHRPARVDIGLSITGEMFVAPVLVFEGADRKTIAELADETMRRVPEIREADRRMLRSLRRWGRLVPFGVLRRAMLRVIFARADYRRQVAGTFQVSTVPVEWALTSTFVATGVLVAGPVLSRVVVVNGQPAVRPTMLLTLSADHGVWDGRGAARFLAAVRSELEAPAAAGQSPE